MRLINKIRKHGALLSVFAVSMIPLLWFIGKGPAIVNGVDTNFPLDPVVWFLRRFSIWNPIGNAGSDFSSSTAGIFFHFLQVIPYSLGLDLQKTQIFTMVFWFFMITFGAFLLSRKLSKNVLVQILGVSFYSLNTYIFNTWENMKVSNLALVASLPYMIWLVLEVTDKKISPIKIICLSCLIGVLASGSGINPAYFATVITTSALVYVVSAFYKKVGKRDFVTMLGLLFTPFILVNTFWIFPTVSFLLSLKSTNSLATIGFTDWVNSLSKDTSIINVIRLLGAWDWYSQDSSGAPIYIPYSIRYLNHPGFIVFSFVFFVISILSFIFRKANNKHLYVSSILLLLVAVFLSTGTHEPTGTLFRFFANHIPFFSFFRSPWYIFTPVIIVSYLLLQVLFFDTILKKTRNSYSRFGINSLLIILIAGNLVYNYPLLTGKIFRPSKPDSFFVNFPSYVLDTKEYLSSRRDRLIVYPDDELEAYEWGYRGIESLTSLYSNRNVLYPSFNALNAGMAPSLTEFYQSLKLGEYTRANQIANRLAAGELLVKDDQRTLAPKIVLPEQNSQFGKWTFYNLNKAEPLVSAADSIYSAEREDIYKVLPLLPEKSVLVSQNDSLLNQPIITPFKGEIIRAKGVTDELGVTSEGLSYNDSNIEALKTLVFKWVAKGDTPSKIIVRKGNMRFPENEVNIILNGSSQKLKIVKEDDTYIYFEELFLKEGDQSLVLLIPQNSEVQYALRSQPSDPLYQYFIKDGIINLRNKSKQSYPLEFDITDFHYTERYLVSGEYRHINGSSGSIAIIQSDKQTNFKILSDKLTSATDWVSFAFNFKPVIVSSNGLLQLIVENSNTSAGTYVQFKGLSIHKIPSTELYVLQEPLYKLKTPSVTFTTTHPYQYSLSVTEVDNPHILIFRNSYSPQWELKDSFHFTADGYANGYLVYENQNYDNSIIYTSQKYYLWGQIISVITLCISTLTFPLSKIIKWQR